MDAFEKGVVVGVTGAGFFVRVVLQDFFSVCWGEGEEVSWKRNWVEDEKEEGRTRYPNLVEIGFVSEFRETEDSVMILTLRTAGQRYN